MTETFPKASPYKAALGELTVLRLEHSNLLVTQDGLCSTMAPFRDLHASRSCVYTDRSQTNLGPSGPPSLHTLFCVLALL